MHRLRAGPDGGWVRMIWSCQLYIASRGCYNIADVPRLVSVILDGLAPPIAHILGPGRFASDLLQGRLPDVQAAEHTYSSVC